MIVRELNGLYEYIDLSIVHPHMGALGWSFYSPIRSENGEYPATTGDVGKDDGIAQIYGANWDSARNINKYAFPVK